nr:hypothetical protein [Tanacetum cinerariifolium]
MESLSPQVVSAAKLHILNPNEFNIWKMRIAQYFLMTNYSLWEVILNGDSPAPTRVVDGVLQPVAPTTAAQRLARKNELKACENRFGGNTETKKVQKTLLKQQYKNFSGSSTESLDQIHDRLQKLISQLEILGVSLSQEDINLKFLRSLLSAAAGVSAVSAKMPIFSLLNVDSLSNAVIYLFFASQSFSTQLDNDDLKQIDTGRNLGANGPTSMGFNMSKVECYSCHRKGHFARECRSLKDTRRNEFQAEEEPTNYALMAFSSSSSSSDNEVFTRAMFDCDDYLYSGSDESLPPSHIYDRYQSGNGYHVVPPPYTGTFMSPKPDLVFNNAPNDVKTDHPAFNVKLSPTNPDHDLSLTNRPSEPIIEDWVSDSKDESETKTPHNVPTATPKPASPKPTSNGKCRNRKACFVCKSLDHLIKDCDYHEKKMAQPTARNHAHKGNHKRYAQMTLQTPQRHMVPVAVFTQSKPVLLTAVRPFSIVVLKIHVTRPRHAKLVVTKHNSPLKRHINRSPSPKASNSPPRVTAVKALMVNATQEKAGEESDQQYVLFPIWSSGSTNPQNADGDAAFDEKEPEFNEKKHESEVNVSPSSKFKDFSDNSINEDNAADEFNEGTHIHFGSLSKQKKDGIFISQYKYVAKILRKFRLTDGKLASTPIDTEKPLLKDPNSEDVDVHTYRSMIGSLMYLTSSRPDIMFAFWTTVAVKKVNDVTRLQVLVDKKKVVITKATIRDGLYLDDAEGVECLSNEEIFAELATMGNEKPSTKLTFYKAFFSSHLVRNVDSPTEFYMYPRFLQLIIRKQVGDLSTYTTKYTSPALTLKVFANMRRVVEGAADEVHGEDANAGDVAEGDVGAANDEVPTDDEEPSIPSPTPSTPPLQPSHDIPSTSQVQLTPPQSHQRVDTSDDTVMDDVSNQGRMIAEMDKDSDVVLEEVKEAKDVPAEVQEVVEVVTTAKLITEVVTAASTTITAAEVPVPAATIAAAPTLTATPRRRTNGVVIRDPEEFTTTTSIIVHSEDKSKDKDWDEVIDHVNKKAKEDPAMKRCQALKRKPQTEAQARKNMMLYLKNVAGFKMDYFKRMSYDDIRHIFEAKFNSNVAFLQKTKEQIEEEESRVLKRINETPTEKAAKRQKLDEEVEELKRHLQIVPNEDDDVYTEATTLARKIPVVGYEIINQNNKPYYKMIRADAKVKGWKMLESCGVQIITFTTTQLILLVEKKYPLTRFTLDQMLNAVRLEVDEESEVSLELLSFGVDAAKELKKCQVFNAAGERLSAASQDDAVD